MTQAGPKTAEKLEAFEAAVVSTVAYTDVFDYPLTPAEVHRYLVGVRAPLQRVEACLANGALVPEHLARCEGFVMLRGREEIVEVRKRRAQRAAEIWPRARYWGRLIAALPFVRMLAVTGSLAVDNVDDHADIDYMIVTAPARLWLCRAMVILLVRYAAGKGDALCPNYFLSEQALALSQQGLFWARELAQMQPLFGFKLYQRLRDLNGWCDEYLPNAAGPPGEQFNMLAPPTWWRPLRATAEAVLRTPLGGRLERWEMERKIRKFQAAYTDQAEAAFSADWCKGHFEGHGQRIMSAFSERLQTVDETTS